MSKASMHMFWLFLTLFLQEISAFFDIDEINSVHYGIDILDQPVVMTEEPNIGSVFLASKYGQQYQCTYAEKSLEDELKEKEEEKVAMETGIADLLKSMENSPCLVITKGWWTYEFCFGKNIKQYHVEDGKITGNVLYLGHYASDYDWSNTTKLRKQKSWPSRYHTQQYVNGTDCDLTTKSRRTEVRFYCERSQGDYITRVDETETCVYTLSVQTNKICNHPYLKPPTPQKAVPITCNPLLSADDFQEYTSMQANIEAEKKMRQQVLESQRAASELGSISDLFGEGEEGTLTNQEAGDESLADGISRQLIEGIKEAFGENTQDKIQVKSMKVKPVKTTGDLNDLLREALLDEETEPELDDLEPEHEGQITEMDMDAEDTAPEDADEVDEDGTIENEDEEYIIEFDKELDDFVESEGHLQQIKDYKETLQKEVGERFDQILDEAKAELVGDLEDDIDVDTDAVTKTMSETLTKLIKQLESKTTTGKTKSGSAKLDMDSIQKSKGSSQSSPASPVDGPSQTTSQPTEESSQTHQLDSEDNEFGEDEDYVNVEYDLEYGETEPPTEFAQVDSSTDPVDSSPDPSVTDSGSGSDSKVKGNLAQAETRPSTAAFEQKTQTMSSGPVKVKIVTKQFRNAQNQAESKDEDAVTNLDNDKNKIVFYDDDAEERPTNVEKPTSDSETLPGKSNEPIVRKWKKIKVPQSSPVDHKIQVKIFTTADYYEEATADMLESGTELNKMIVAVLGGNTEEIQEARKQNELESNYGFVWNKDKKAKTKEGS